jgi:putative colanic acid biosynthesis acetyltransferase WcaF
MNTDSSNDKNQTVDLERYRVTGYSPGAGILRRGLWYLVNALVYANPLFPFYGVKRLTLRLFGARIGPGVVIKPRTHIKHPWRLRIGEHSWIGENVWIDNLVEVEIGSNVCISQGAYLLTGNHDYKSTAFTLITKPIRIEDGAWVGARGVVCPGVTMGRNAVLTVGSVLTRDAESNGIYAGNPAQRVRARFLE